MFLSQFLFVEPFCGSCYTINASMELRLQNNHRARHQSSQFLVHSQWPTCGVGFVWLYMVLPYLLCILCIHHNSCTSDFFPFISTAPKVIDPVYLFNLSGPPHGGFPSHGGTPSHPFIYCIGIGVSMKSCIYCQLLGYPPAHLQHLWT